MNNSFSFFRPQFIRAKVQGLSRLHAISGFSQILNAVIPQYCLLCGHRGSGDRLICSGCENDMPWLGHACSVCALPLPVEAPDICGHCLRKKPAYDHSKVLFHYESPLDKLVTGLKFNDRLVNARLLGDMLAARTDLQGLSKPEALLPVPLHKKRLRKRGFNQALELARPLAKAWGIPILSRSVKRVRATAAQMELPAKERQRNIRGAFECVAEIPYRHVAIVDDVVTTGSTANELAITLKTQGVQTVLLIAVGRVA